MTNQAKNVPELRFPEFDGEWEEKQLNNIVDSLKGNSNDNEELPVLTISAKKGWMNQKERFSQVIAGNSLSKYNELKKGDLSYNKGNSKVAIYGIVYKLNYDRALVPNVYKSFRPKSNYESDFIEKYFHTKILDKQLRKLISSTARMDGLLNISDNDFYSMLINIPTKKEQQKIGEFFSKLDRQIELEEQKLEKLEEQKKGYMQKLFSQELRFKDDSGCDYPNWKYNYLGNYMISHDEKTTENNQYPVLTSSREGLFLQKDYFTRDVASKDNTGYNVVPYGYFTYRHMSDDLVFKFNINYIVQKGIVSTLYPVFKTTSDLDNYFLKEILNNGNEFKKYALMQKQGGSRTYMYFSKLKQLKLHIPVLKEQEKISVLLKKLDSLIEKQSYKVELLKERKKGFLQKMFV